MATIKLPGSRMMNQNVTPAKLEGTSSIGDAYKAIGKAAQSLGQNIIKQGERNQKLVDDGWVLKKRRQIKEEQTQATIDHRKNMDATTGMQRVENKDGTWSVGSVSYEDTQKKWLEDKYSQFKKEAEESGVSDAGYASFEQKHAPDLLASISADKSHVTKERLDGFEVTIHDNQDSRGASIIQHDPEATGVSLLQHTVAMTKEHDDELLETAQGQGYSTKRYNKMFERGNTINAGSYFEKSLDNKDWGGVAVGGGYFQKGFEESTLKSLNGIAKTQLGTDQKLKVKRTKINGKTFAEVVTEDETKQFNLASGMLEDYDGSTASYEPDTPLINRLQPQQHLDIYGRLMKGLDTKIKGHGAMVTDKMEQTKAVIFGPNGFDVTSEEGVARRAELHEDNNSDMVTPQWKKDKKSAEIDGMFIVGTAMKGMATQSPTLYAKNKAQIDKDIEKMAAGNPFIAAKQIMAMKAEVAKQRVQQVKDMNEDGGTYLLRHSKTAQSLYSATQDKNLSDEEKTAAWYKYGNFVNDKLKELGVQEANRQTMPDIVIGPKFAALEKTLSGVDPSDPKAFKLYTEAVGSARDIFKYLSREESNRMMNKYGKKLNEPRIAIIAKMEDGIAAAKVLASLSIAKLNKANGSDGGLTKKNKNNIKSKIRSESNTTELLQKVLEMEGGGIGLQNSYESLIQVHAENIMASTGIDEGTAVQQATNDIMGEYDIKSYGGHYSKNMYSIPKAHIKENGWSEGQIQETVDVIQNPTFLENNIDIGGTLGNLHKNHVNMIYKLNNFKHEGYKELIEIKMTRAMFNPESQFVFGKDPINKKRLKSWAKKNEMSYEEAEKKYMKLDVRAMELPKIEGQYIAEEKRFAPVMRMPNGRIRRVKAREGAEYNRNGYISVSPHETSRFGLIEGEPESNRKIPGLGTTRTIRGRVKPVIEQVGD